MTPRRCSILLALPLAAACGGAPSSPPNAASEPPEETAPSAPPAAPAGLAGLARADFNRAAAELALPLFWSSDADGDGALDPGELAVYWGLDPAVSSSDFVDRGWFTPRMRETFERIAAQTRTQESDARRVAVRKELAQGRVTLAATDMSRSSDAEKRFVAKMFAIGELIERLYAKQQAVDTLAAKIPADDPASKTLFFRGARGEGHRSPRTIRAARGAPARRHAEDEVSGMYPTDLLAQNPKFCAELQTGKDKALADPFTAVVKEGDGLSAKPFHETWPAETEAIAKELEAAAALLGGSEPALVEYLQAAAKAFRTDDWWPADEAWAKMDAKNSKFYRGGRTVYDEPAASRRSTTSAWASSTRGPALAREARSLKGEMEGRRRRRPYKARGELQAADFMWSSTRRLAQPFGATIGQSLPNFGPVANGGRVAPWR